MKNASGVILLILQLAVILVGFLLIDCKSTKKASFLKFILLLLGIIFILFIIIITITNIFR